MIQSVLRYRCFLHKILPIAVGVVVVSTLLVPAVYAAPPDLKAAEPIMQNVLNALWGLGGLAFFLMLVVGGIKYLMSTGDPQKAAEAQQTLIWGVVGLLGLLGGFVILNLVMDKIVGFKPWDAFHIFTDARFL